MGEEDAQDGGFADDEWLAFEDLHRFQPHFELGVRPERPMSAIFQWATAQVLDPVLVILSRCIRLTPDARLVADAIFERCVRHKGVFDIR